MENVSSESSLKMKIQADMAIDTGNRISSCRGSALVKLRERPGLNVVRRSVKSKTTKYEYTEKPKIELRIRANISLPSGPVQPGRISVIYNSKIGK